jgi:hypothetical protein
MDRQDYHGDVTALEHLSTRQVETARMLSLPDNWRELQERARPFECGINGARWHIYCSDPAILPRWWTLDDAAGRIRRFKTHSAALKVAARLNVQAEVIGYARQQAAKLRECYAAAEAHNWDNWGWRIWEGVNCYPGVRASLWGSDPLGLFTADLKRPFCRWNDPAWQAEQRAAA